jgi:hypothetical protein
MGKGASYRKGHNPAKQRANYDEINWSKGKRPEATKKKGKSK